MPWAKLDDQIYCHPKMQACDGFARALNVAAITYCSAQLTDGFVPRHAPQLIMAMAGFVLDQEQLADCIRQLVEAGLWEALANGYGVHDYLEYNPSRAQVLAQRQHNATRQQEWRERKRGSNAASNGISNGASVSAPVPLPLPLHNTATTATTRARASNSATTTATDPTDDSRNARFFELVHQSGMILSPLMAEQYQDVLADVTDFTLVEDAFAEAARSDQRPTPRWLQSVLERCVRERCRPGQWRDKPRGRESPRGNGPDQRTYDHPVAPNPDGIRLEG